MKTMNSFLRYATIGTLAVAILATSCRRKSKDETVDPDPDLTTERDITNANNDDNSLLKDIDKALDNSSANLREEATGYFILSEKDSTKTINGVTYSKYMKITYTSTADDGQSRSGVTEIFAVGKRTTGDFKAYASFSGTKVGGRTITGTRTIVQETSDDANKWKFTISASGTVTTIDGRVINYSSNRTRVRTGVSTLVNLTDDSFTITGSWAGTNGDGDNVAATITSPLQLAYSCHYFREITSGKIDFTNSTKGITRSVDYGNGGCDGVGTFINAKGKAFTFAFKR